MFSLVGMWNSVLLGNLGDGAEHFSELLFYPSCGTQGCFQRDSLSVISCCFANMNPPPFLLVLCSEWSGSSGVAAELSTRGDNWGVCAGHQQCLLQWLLCIVCPECQEEAYSFSSLSRMSYYWWWILWPLRWGKRLSFKFWNMWLLSPSPPIL